MKSNLTTSFSLLELKNNPFYFSELISSACLGFTAREANLLDIYIILPLLLYQAGADKLKKKITAKSSIYSIYLKDNIAGIAGLEERIKKLKSITIESLVIAVNSRHITIDEITLDIKVSTEFAKYIKKQVQQEKRLYKQALNLGKILSQNEIKENYRLLGVKNL
ncbi:hypothetical protein DWV12_14550 [Clostridium botulinum]|uniref:three component ABC system middle component n=1 Tax=Clostridium botulinum TaxID=1491 RepID=UPI00217D96A9|nr:three component ABC system middle component [Clostridium botulinum]MCS6103531.1 hypothetical protein [Clostridium botulinum]MCS6108568.1 hypothetical protein [Clostridium botulinum]